MPKYKIPEKLVCFDKYKCNCCKIEKEINVNNYEIRNKLNGRFSLQCKLCMQNKATERDRTPEGRKRQLEKRARTLEYQAKYKQGESYKKSSKRWAKSKRGRATRDALENKRRAAKLQRTPKWADLEAITEFYRNRPEGMHVDHIGPLQGKNVCRLHVLENLQYLTPSENARKRNKF